VVVAVAAGITGAYVIGGGSVFLTLLAAVILIVALWPVFTPTRYLLDAKGVTLTRPFRRDFRPWDKFRRYDVGRLNVLLSPFPSPSRLDSFRGLVLRLAGNRDEVVAFVAKRLQAVTEGPDIWK
jgi:hypothetical protein